MSPSAKTPSLSLFWRTFLLISALLGASLAGTWFAFASIEQGPRAARVALQISSLVNLTRNALVNSQEQRRVQLLEQIARDESARVRVLEPADSVTAPVDTRLQSLIEKRLKELLGENTRFASVVNNEAGFWLSFAIEEDQYWLVIDARRLEDTKPNLWLLGAAALLLALISAWVFSRIVNRPLQQLGDAIAQLSAGAKAPVLAQDGPTELAQINRHFNQLAIDLEQLEADRTLALAGISHDIRTPLTRLRLEIEMASLPESQRDSMSDEVQHIDGIVGQFIDYARAHSTAPLQSVDVNHALASINTRYSAGIERQEIAIHLKCPESLTWFGRPIDLDRMVLNLVENACRYGKRDGVATLQVQATKQANVLTIVVSDDGEGVPASHHERLLRPFARMDEERSAAGGSGLGLAIVNKLAQKYGGGLRLQSGPAQATAGVTPSKVALRGLHAILTLSEQRRDESKRRAGPPTPP